jgi:1-acyl-sn-glycerol-3-phosphate acyltransferase
MASGPEKPASALPLWRIIWWRLLHAICWLWMVVCYRYRCWGTGYIPRTGPVLFVSNHQSHFDPILAGLGLWRRPFYALARTTLWHNPLLAWLISSLNAIPVERNSGDLKAMRRCMDVLIDGQTLLLFPEGTRTPHADGHMGRFKPGLLLIIKRSRPRIVPVAIEGAQFIWPRTRKFPCLTGRIGVMYGQPIDACVLIDLPPDQAMEHLQQHIETMRQEVARRLAHAGN